MKLAIALTLAASANAFAPTNMAGNVSRKNVKNVGPHNCTDRPKRLGEAALPRNRTRWFLRVPARVKTLQWA